MFTCMLGLFVCSFLSELLIYTKSGWKRRSVIAAGLILLLAAISGTTIALQPSPLGILLTLLSAMRIFNLLRLVEGRNQEAYLRKSTYRTSWYLGVVQAGLIVCLTANITLAAGRLLLIVAMVQVVVAFMLLLSVARSLRKTLPEPIDHFYADKELPSVSVLIPARNETEDLEACLRSLIASDYPKLEIVVLDDCSRDRTPEIIRGFAQDGVRFIGGIEPDDNWLAKNYAYQRLSEAATGEVLLFCGVDTRFGGHTIRLLVTNMLSKHKDMLSVMPKRMTASPYAAFVQPLRYWWELALPRRYFNRPPVLSTCWLITREALHKSGGFAAVKHAIIPEAFLARELTRHDGYSFVRAEGDLELTTRKSWHDQVDTAIRVRYPQIHRRPELAFLLAMLELLLLLGPFAVCTVGIVTGTASLTALAAVAILLLIITHVLIMSASDPGNVPLALINFPLVVVVEIVLGLTSMARYEFSVVEWKGRNICIPVMQVVPRLPKS